MKLFEGHSSAHGTHGVPERDGDNPKWGIKGTARTLREPVTEKLWVEHLAGRVPLGVICIREDSRCRWGAIDVDEYSEDLIDIIHRVDQRKLPLVPCRSKSGGLHLFLFLDRFEPASEVQSKLRDLAASLGLTGSEIFPKQTRVLSERGDVGNWIVMPYYGDTFGGKLREQVGVKKTGAEMTVEEFLEIAEERTAALDDVKARPAPARNGKDGAASSSQDFADGPPCLAHLADGGVPDGTRNNVLFHMGVYFRKKFQGSWKQHVERANQAYMDPPLTSEETSSLIKSLDRKTYEYTCKIEPMCSHCDAARCRTRKFGVGDEGSYPTIDGLSKLETQPPVWFVDVSGARLELSTEQLQSYNLFHRACMDGINFCFRAMKQADWLLVVNEAMQNLTPIEAPPDIGAEGRFQEHLEEFLTNMMVGERREDILTGRPWEDTEASRYYFRLGDLHKFLDRENVRDETGQRFTRIKMTRYLSRLGGEHRFIKIRGKGVNTWWVPSNVVTKTPEVEPPGTGEPL